jgi:CrcB protein
LVLGAIAGAGSHLSPNLSLLIGTGFCATLSTYSTFSHETMRLAQTGARIYAFANVAISVVAGLGAAALGWSLGAVLH